ncbi:GatB/YqeY domain-containing protein [Patescibacteria group bacterium]|nr:GatB/YqeY domain-containing protein [Patescibacteria group bacterium]MBU0777162.1 GatB/YqeY domain-containing protein [Patescibacteria group bacterium]MBU0845856.1 GatB/YqeY domain-containing protein [Patescibacteria group bacterium]MBU0922883.1 GatB/YqeY domain-containing protein [Patescibacteria group bacterium]MBU1066384.1 GatB/YqeY domain-containing protein [Patescibacteria group bacterium]
MITEKIKIQIIEALKSGDKLKMSTLKLLSSALHNAQIKKREELSEEEELEVVKREAKMRKDAIEAYEKAGATDRAEKEKKELIILQEYLPEELSEKEIEKIVDEVITSTGAADMKDMGKAIGVVMGKCKGKADGKKVSEMVRSKLS